MVSLRRPGASQANRTQRPLLEVLFFFSGGRLLLMPLWKSPVVRCSADWTGADSRSDPFAAVGPTGHRKNEPVKLVPHVTDGQGVPAPGASQGKESEACESKCTRPKLALSVYFLVNMGARRAEPQTPIPLVV